MANVKKAKSQVEVEVVDKKSDLVQGESAPLFPEEIKEVKKEESDIPVVEVSETPIDHSNKVEQNVKIKLKENHKCWVGGECYSLEKGKVYTVPKEVKMRLSKAGVLLPL